MEWRKENIAYLVLCSLNPGVETLNTTPTPRVADRRPLRQFSCRFQQSYILFSYTYIFITPQD